MLSLVTEVPAAAAADSTTDSAAEDVELAVEDAVDEEPPQAAKESAIAGCGHKCKCLFHSYFSFLFFQAVSPFGVIIIAEISPANKGEIFGFRGRVFGYFYFCVSFSYLCSKL